MKDKLRHVGIHELANRPVPPMLVEGIMPSKGIVEVVSEPGGGKTFFALECAIACALGRKAFGAFATMPVKALYVGEDSPDWDIGQQLRKMVPSEDWDEIEDKLRLSVHEGAELNTPAGMVRILNTIEDVFVETDAEGETSLETGLVILDSLRTMHSGSENDSDWMAGVMRRIKELAKPVGVMVLHHKGKSGQVQKEAWEESRGSGEIVAASDAVLRLNKKGDRRFCNPVRARGIRAVEFAYDQIEEEMSVRLVAVDEHENLKEFMAGKQRFKREELLDFLTTVMPKAGPAGIRTKAQKVIARLLATGVATRTGWGVYEIKVSSGAGAEPVKEG